jgi:hypothetical protein
MASGAISWLAVAKDIDHRSMFNVQRSALGNGRGPSVVMNLPLRFHRSRRKMMSKYTSASTSLDIDMLGIKALRSRFRPSIRVLLLQLHRPLVLPAFPAEEVFGTKTQSPRHVEHYHRKTKSQARGSPPSTANP